LKENEILKGIIRGDVKKGPHATRKTLDFQLIKRLIAHSTGIVLKQKPQ
jgi:hypothetical protein